MWVLATAHYPQFTPNLTTSHHLLTFTLSYISFFSTHIPAMAFANARNVQVYGSNFTDVGGDMNVYRPEGDIVFNNVELGLQQLMKIACPGAAFDSHDRCPPPECYPGTRRDVLNDISAWIESRELNPIIWLHGPAGAGKSAVAQTICEKYAEQGLLAASFFFSRSVASRNTIIPVFPTITFQIAMSTPERRKKIDEVINKGPYITPSTNAAHFNDILVDSLGSESLSSKTSPFLVVIDGLDECTSTSAEEGDRGNRAQLEILAHISQLVFTHELPLSFLIVSRPEPHITTAFTRSIGIRAMVSLYGEWSAVADIQFYLKKGFEDIRNSDKHACIMSSVSKPWPDLDVIENLVERSSGYFIYASTVLKYVDADGFSPLRRLDEVLEVTTSTSSPFAELDNLYAHILLSWRNPDVLKAILAYIMVLLHAQDGLHFATTPLIEAVLQFPPGEVVLAVRHLHSLFRIGTGDPPRSRAQTAQAPIFVDFLTSISVRSNAIDYHQKLANNDHEQLSRDGIHILHASFPDFLFDEERAGNFFIDLDESNENIFLACLDIFSNWEYKDTDGISSKTRIQIFKNWVYHFREISDKDSVFDHLRHMLSMAWTGLIAAALEWEPAAQAALAEMLYVFSDELTGFEPISTDIVVQVTTIFDNMCHALLPTSTSDDILFIQCVYGIVNLRAYLRGYDISNGHEILRSRVQSFADLFELAGSFKDHWIRIFEFVALAHTSIKCFMEQPERSNDLFVEGPVRESLLTSYCVRYLVGNYLDHYLAFPGSRPEEYDYALCYWHVHLARAQPGNPHLLHCLRVSGSKLYKDIYKDLLLDPRTYGSIEGMPMPWEIDYLVVKWLNKMKDSPSDVLELWKYYVSRWFEGVLFPPQEKPDVRYFRNIQAPIPIVPQTSSLIEVTTKEVIVPVPNDLGDFDVHRVSSPSLRMILN
ncbi:hypothetical protein Hypma_003084 [Hypsizygus marmoreus]|uniref:Nephrocystin 3-like N-terminal domain-containing protein n=1 Tax=Hypsizygus marmoreus TaxID=39966 RepID=A0A369J2T4_HYPMA|nr:hypothetical protein Hypma_003084 [Hypsizygus marmoreus]